MIKLFYPGFIGDTKSFDKSLNGFNVLMANFPHLDINASTMAVAQPRLMKLNMT